MAKAPGEAADFDGAGPVWFKVFQDMPAASGGQYAWPSDGECVRAGFFVSSRLVSSRLVSSLLLLLRQGGPLFLLERVFSSSFFSLRGVLFLLTYTL